MKTRSPLFTSAGVSDEISISLDDGGIARLVAQTHADVNKIRASRGLPPHDFSKGPKTSREGNKSLQMRSGYRRKGKTLNYIWPAKNYGSTSNPILPKSKRKAANA